MSPLRGGKIDAEVDIASGLLAFGPGFEHFFGGGFVDANEVVADLWKEILFVGFDASLFVVAFGHVAVNAIRNDLVTACGELAAVFGLMTLHAAL